MADLEYREMQEVLRKHDFHFKKKYGQNFLIKPDLLHDIVDGAEVTDEDTVVEIGPGVGSLTRVLADRAKQVYAIEVDEKLIPILDETMAGYDNVTIINEDVLKTDLTDIFAQGRVKVVANLPYYITTPIILGLLEKDLDFESITVMVQKEVAERMQAQPGTKDYGALTLAVGYYTDPQILFLVSPDSFVPQPKVGSAVISLKKKELTEQQRADAKDIFTVVRAAFNQRRKSMANALSNAGVLGRTKDEITEAVQAAGFDTNVRAEALTPDDFIRLTECLKR
ncbi:MAG: 16S rRNA (adenine(1518)-N(6)/adenine(1519)-N(6))-dimethyltransferase RsmA [Lachnospiraceae bacterium]|nr:16S rRNA (adenine(1518)-N(6)/adenine(1519)-N(6))-dimethyltransferase RsmA [Lachnospiraceae bacterium]MDD7327179.1 16S rRNA (adenine(1518)-N(6)/adenine(1519)-N(6))-dimethyltransferase RsmA [Lachnospiraceae bacterium]MDY2759043.1 16S rRNA (adenine(1518)-N(6)/adenine(1519)-N(6))-dimethyltransferase RsmA [Lachnospiraceae bacterium]